jgi:hypothetical protein
MADTFGHHFNARQQATFRAVMELSEDLISFQDCQDLVQTNLIGGHVERDKRKWIFEFPQPGKASRIIYFNSLFGYADQDFIKDLRFALLELGIDKSCL